MSIGYRDPAWGRLPPGYFEGSPSPELPCDPHRSVQDILALCGLDRMHHEADPDPEADDTPAARRGRRVA